MNTFTNILKRLSATAVLMLAVVFFAQAQESEGFSLSGSVDTYFRTNLNAKNYVDIDADGEADFIQAPGSSFAGQPGFAIGMVNLIAGYEGEKVGFVADLVFGPRGGDAVFGSGFDSDGDGLNDAANAATFVNQLYVYWNVSDALTFTLGNFNTFLGYEVISPTGNFNYSTSYMFSYGPFSHTGLKADLSFGEGFSFMAAVMNPTDATEFNPSGDYVGGFQLGYTNDMGGAWLNSIISEDFFQIDLTTGWDVSETVYVGFNATSASDNFLGAALYLQNSFSDAFALGLRGEYFQDKGLGLLTMDENVIDLTLSANYSVGNLTLIPEVRLDSFSQGDFIYTEDPDPTSPASTKVTSSLSSFVLAAVYAF